MTQINISKFDNSSTRKAHVWVTVVNPTNHQLLLQACDDCGVVKSENSIVKRCRAKKGLHIVSFAMQERFHAVG